MKCERCHCEEMVECHGSVKCSRCGCVVEECCQGIEIVYPPADPSDNEKDVPN